MILPQQTDLNSPAPRQWLPGLALRRDSRVSDPTGLCRSVRAFWFCRRTSLGTSGRMAPTIPSEFIRPKRTPTCFPLMSLTAPHQDAIIVIIEKKPIAIKMLEARALSKAREPSRQPAANAIAVVPMMERVRLLPPVRRRMASLSNPPEGAPQGPPGKNHARHRAGIEAMNASPFLEIGWIPAHIEIRACRNASVDQSKQPDVGVAQHQSPRYGRGSNGLVTCSAILKDVVAQPDSHVDPWRDRLDRNTKSTRPRRCPASQKEQTSSASQWEPRRNDLEKLAEAIIEKFHGQSRCIISHCPADQRRRIEQSLRQARGTGTSVTGSGAIRETRLLRPDRK